MSDDHIELGETGLVPLADGWFKNIHTNETIDPNGCVFDEKGELVFDPNDESDDQYGPEEYDFD